MLTALAPSGPVAPAVPISPPSTKDTTQPVQRESFKDVYGNVPTQDQSQNDAGSKPKATHSTDAKGKKFPFLTDLDELNRLASAGVLSFESLYGKQ